MIKISVIAAAVAAAVLALAAAPASARCSDDNPCANAAPMNLDQFMKTWKPVGASTKKKYRTSRSARSTRRHTVEQAAAKPARETRPAREARQPVEAKVSAAAREPAQAPTVRMAAAEPAKPVETDGVAVTSFDAVNEIDAAIPERVQIVAFNEVNEIDLTAPPAPPAPKPSAPVETVSQAMAATPEADDLSWVGKLLLAAAGTLALAGAARLLVA